MGADAPTIVFIPVHCAPQKAPCPKCGKLGKRKRTCTREVRTVAFKAVAYLKITYGEYTAQCECCTTFRNTPEGVLPKAHYDNKVRDLVLDRIIKDGMSIERILESLRREFLLELSSGFVYNVLLGPKNSICPNIAAWFWNISAAPSVWTNCTWAASHCFWLLIR